MLKNELLANVDKDMPLNVQVEKILSRTNCSLCVDTLAFLLDKPRRDITEALQQLRRYGQAKVVAISQVQFWIKSDSTPQYQPVFTTRRTTRVAKGWQKIEEARA